MRILAEISKDVFKGRPDDRPFRNVALEIQDDLNMGVDDRRAAIQQAIKSKHPGWSLEGWSELTQGLEVWVDQDEEKGEEHGQSV